MPLFRTRRRVGGALARTVLALSVAASALGAQQAPRAASGDSAAVAAAVEGFHAALARGDSLAALALLTADARVIENDEVETREQYRAHHVAADIEFARAVASVRHPQWLSVSGDSAWAAAGSTSRGTFRGRPVDSEGDELMMLVRRAEGWRIAAIRWSSRRRGAPASSRIALAPESGARALPGNPPPRYPTQLRSLRVSGQVLARFVVDTSGRADMRTFEVLRSTHPLFDDEVRQVLRRYRFEPATIDGQKVKQVVVLPFDFACCDPR